MSPANQYEAMLEEVGPVAPQAVEDNPYAAVLKEQTTREEAAFRVAQQQAQQTPPDRAAEALRLSDYTGLPPDVVHRNFDDIQKRSGIADTAYTDLQRRSPATAAWLAQPANAAVARDDVAALAQAEFNLSFLGAITRGAAKARALLFSAEEYAGDVFDVEAWRAAGQAGRRRNVAMATSLTPPATPFAGPWDIAQYVKETVGEQVPIYASSIVGATTGAAIGSVVPGVGTALGAVIGALLPAAGYGVGEVQLGVKETGGEEARAPWTVFVGGSAIAAFDTMVPGRIGAKLVRTFGWQAGEAIAQRALASTVKPQFLRLVAGEAVRDLRREGLTEALQEAIGAHAVALGTDTSVDYWQLGQQMVEAGTAGALLGGVSGGVTGVAEFRHERHRIAVAQAAADRFTALGDALKDSKTLARLPAAAQAFIAHATKDGPLETVYMDTAAFTTYWQSKGVDPALVAQELLGNTTAYPEAVRTGEALAIPTAAYAVKIATTEHNTFFAQELRLAPAEMNAREATIYREVLARTMAEATAAAAAAPPTTEPTPAQAADPIYASLYTQLIAAGRPRALAHADATLAASFYRNLEAVGVDPVAHFQRRGWIITGPATPAAAAPAAPRPVEEADYPTIRRILEGEDLTARAPLLRALFPDYDTAQPQPGDYGANIWGELNEPTKWGAARLFFTDLNQRIREARAAGRLPARLATTETADGTTATAPAAGLGLPDVTGEQPHPDQGGLVEGRGDGDVARDRGLPAARLPELDELFARQPAAVNAARLTPEVTRELDRILQEMREFGFVKRTWNWLTGKKTGTAAGGAADIVAGTGGALVYEDILAYAPVNLVTSGAHKGEPAREASAKRARVITAIATALETRDIHNNLAEGAVRVAELRAAGQWTGLHKAELPPTWGVEASVPLTDALGDAIDDALAAGEGEGDLSFDVGELELAQEAAEADTPPEDTFKQAMRPDIPGLPLTEDVLETGEVQPRLPGAENVRETEQATPEFDAPFSLTPEAAPVPGKQTKQTTLFQASRRGLRGTMQAFQRTVAPWLTPKERATIIKDQAQRAIAIFKQLPRDIDFAAAAVAAQSKRGWYRQAIRAVEVLVRPKDAPRFMALLAALSPQTNVKTDLRNTVRVWIAWKRAVKEGRPLDHASLATLIKKALPKTQEGLPSEVLPAWVENGVLALSLPDPTDIELSGPKVNSFLANLLGDFMEVTNDTWMATFAGLVQKQIFAGTEKTATQPSRKGAGYYAYNAKVRRVTELVQKMTDDPTWTPAEVQETVWSWTYTLGRLVDETGLTPEQVVRQGLITDAALAKTPDFAGLLLRDPSIRGILEKAGYGAKLRQLDTEFARGPARPGTGGPAQGAQADYRRGGGRGEAQRALLRTAGRVAEVRADRPRTLNQSPLAPAPPFYSRLTRAVETSTLAKASGAQWKATIANAKAGISRDEFAYARVEDLADATVYTKADVLAYLAANTLTLEDVTLSEATGPSDEAIEAEVEQIYDRQLVAAQDRADEDVEYIRFDTISVEARYNEDEAQWEAFAGGEDVGSWFDTEQEAIEAAQERADAFVDEQRAAWVREETTEPDRDEIEAEVRARRREDAGDQVQYAEYVEPGAVAGSYREVFLTVPQVRSEATITTLTGLTAEELYELTHLGGWAGTLREITASLAGGRVHEARDHLALVLANLADSLAMNAYTDAERPQVEREQALLQQLSRNLTFGTEVQPVTWEDGHQAYSDITNPVVRLRFNERSVPGPPIERKRFIEPYTPTVREQVQQNYDSNDPRYRVQVEGLATPHPLSFATLAEAEAWLAAHPTYSEPTTQRVLFLEEVQLPHTDQPMPALLRKHGYEIAFKWALRHGAEQGFDVLAVSTGAQQVARYSLEKQVDAIQWGLVDEGGPLEQQGARSFISIDTKQRTNIRAYLNDQGVVLALGSDPQVRRWAGAPLEHVLGKEVAAKIAEKPAGSLEGEGLKIGGEGLKRLYDVAFPRIINKLPAVKAAGGRVTTVPLQSSADMNARYDITETDSGRWRIVERATNLFVPDAPAFRWGYEAEQWLRERGMLDADVPAIALTPAIKAAVLGGQPLFQPAPADAPRAAVTFTPAAIHVQLFAGADASSFMHEAAHIFLEVRGDVSDDLRSRDPATLTPAQQRFVADYDAALQWMGVAHRGQIGVAQHEQWARAWEAYLREGTAPSKELRSVFAQFRSWLLDLYQSLLQLDVVLTPEVRAIFDRMLASDAAIAEAAAEPQVLPLFTTAASAGMTEEAFAQYRALVQAASDQAKAELSARLYRDWERERTATWRAARERIRAEVTAEVQQEPVYRARAAMRTGTYPDGTPLVPGQAPTPIAVNMNPLLPPAEGEISLDAAAELFGFTSGDELAHALRTAPTQRRVIAAKTYARLRAEFGDVPLQRAVLHEKAEEAVYGAGRQVVVQAELKALTAGLQRGVIPPAALLRQHARERIRATRVRDLRPGTFLVAAQRASQRAFDLKESDRLGAVQAKQQELLNLALYREAVAARDTAEATAAWVRRGDREPARRRLGKAGASYLEQWDGILERFEFKRLPLKTVDWRAAVAAWAAAQEADGLPVDLPALILDESKRTNYQNLTVDELADVREGLEHITHLARLKNRLLTAQRQRDFTVAVDTITTSIRAHHPTSTLPLEFLPKDVKARKVSEWFASHKKLANVVRAMDGYRDGGALWEYLLRPINDAATREAALNQEATIALSQLLTRAYTGRDLAHLRDTAYIPAIQGSLSKEARLMVALNWGNAGNRQRLRDGRQWTDAQVTAILDTLDARDVRFVQDVWDYIDTYWPAIAAKQRRVTGLAPEKVEATPFVTQHGTSRGGYFPLAYDPRLSARAGSFIDVEQANLQAQAAYAKATTRRGHTEARAANVKQPIRLELSVLYGHVEQVIHDLSHHEMLIDVGRLLGDRRVQQAIYETHGDIVYRQIKNAVVDIAYGTRPASNVAESAINYLRQGTTVAGLAWNVWTAVQQPLGIFNGMARVGPTWVLRGLTHMLRDVASMESTARWVHERSEMMRLRHTTQQREISELRNVLGRSGSWFDNALRRVTADTVKQQDIADSYFWLIGQAQRLADLPTWIGQYEKSMAAGETEDRAVALAEQAVLDAQGGGQIKDLAQVQRGAPVFKLFTNFYSYGSLLYNQTADAYGQTNFRRAGSVGQFVGNLLLLYTFPAFASILLASAFGRDDDDEGWLHALGRETVSQALNTMVLLRELGGLARLGGGRGYEGPAGTRAIGAAIDVATQAQQGELDRGLLRATEDAAGILFRLPLNQIQRSIDGFVALQQGQTRNPLALLTGPPRK